MKVLTSSSGAVVAEWLRRLTRNQIPSGSVGSSPTDRVRNFFFLLRTLDDFSFLKERSIRRLL